MYAAGVADLSEAGEVIDFDFRSEGSGLVMELQAATAGKPLDSLFIPEDAFGFIEPCVRGAWPEYADFGHWSKTAIPPSVWREIVEAMQALKASLESASQLTDVEGIGFLFAHLRDKFGNDFDANRARLLRMIDETCEWLNIWITRSVDVAIIGV